MNPLCPKCHASLETSLTRDGLYCPSCAYSWGRLGLNVSLDEDAEITGDAEEVDYFQ